MATALRIGLFLMTRLVTSIMAVTLFNLFSEWVYACSVCGFGEDETRQAFLVTTGIMTCIPLLALGGVLFLISRRSSDDDKKE